MSFVSPVRDDYLCPQCRAPVRHVPEPAAYHCTQCDRVFPVLFGIPDFRLAPDRYLTLEEERAKAQHLYRFGQDHSFDELVDEYYRITDDVPPDQAVRFASYVRGGVARGAGVLPALGNGPLLDAGCGAGGLVAAAALAGQKATGTDIALRWLVIGARRLEELGQEAELVCADIATAPFADERFHGLAAIDLFEHVEDQDAAARALSRMLVPGGKLYLASANRYTLAPYPLAGLFGVGYLPRGLRARYVRARRGLDTLRFAALQSPAGLHRRLARHGFSQLQLRALAIPPTRRDDLHGLQKILFPLYSRLRVLPVVGRLLARIGPAFEITGTREFTPR